MKRYLLILAALLALLSLTSCGVDDVVTDEMLEQAYASGYEAGLEAATEEKEHTNAGKTLPIENRSPAATMIPTPNSSAFSSVGYEDGILYVTFRESGYVYSYEDVPSAVYDELWNASSMGGYYNSHIKGAYECHRLS